MSSVPPPAPHVDGPASSVPHSVADSKLKARVDLERAEEQTTKAVRLDLARMASEKEAALAEVNQLKTEKESLETANRWLSEENADLRASSSGSASFALPARVVVLTGQVKALEEKTAEDGKLLLDLRASMEEEKLELETKVATMAKRIQSLDAELEPLREAARHQRELEDERLAPQRDVVLRAALSQSGPSSIKVLLIGDSGVGKTALIHRYVEGKFAQSRGIGGFDFKLKEMSFGGAMTKVQIWDTKGQERFRAITTKYYGGAHAIALVYDSGDRGSFTQLPDWIYEVRRYAQPSVKLLVLANNWAGRTVGVTTEEGLKYAKSIGAAFVSLSATSGKNVDLAFRGAVEMSLGAPASVITELAETGMRCGLTSPTSVLRSSASPAGAGSGFGGGSGADSAASVTPTQKKKKKKKKKLFGLW